jgi:hypothetical protein
MSTFLLFVLVSVLLTAACGVIDVNSEHVVTFPQLAGRLPRRRRDRPVSVTTIHRWRHPGVRGVRLEAVRSGGAWVTSLEAYQRFCEALTRQADPQAAGSQVRKSRDDERVEKELDDLRI